MISEPIVFLGPTLPVAQAREILRADYRPPAAQGDVWRAVADNPIAIAVVDGLFERVPAVWHKEILWAMAQGIPVFGAASMGALRAAELASFGMIGVGVVFEQFHHGTLNADDEVAIAHAGSENGYRPLSEAMVNVRATLQSAEKAGVIAPETACILLAVARSIHFAERTFARILSDERRRSLPAAELAALSAWLPLGRVDQKRLDAQELLHDIGRRIVDGLPRKPPRFHFEHTDAWEATTRLLRSGDGGS